MRGQGSARSHSHVTLQSAPSPLGGVIRQFPITLPSSDEGWAFCGLGPLGCSLKSALIQPTAKLHCSPLALLFCCCPCGCVGTRCFWLFFLSLSMSITKLKASRCIFTGQTSQAMALALPFLVCAWPTAAPGPCSDTWRQTHRSSSYTDLKLSGDLPASFLVMVPPWKLKLFGFSEFPHKLPLSTPANVSVRLVSATSSMIFHSAGIPGTYTSPSAPRAAWYLLTDINPLIQYHS